MKSRLFLIVLAMFILSCWQDVQKVDSGSAKPDILTLPIQLVPDSVKPLRSIIDPGFQSDLEKTLNSNAKWKRLISQKKLAVGVVDLDDPYNPRYARLNGNVMMYAASLPKIAILLASYGCY